ncbi:hypothetical protein [Sulfitobacter dubius]|uniref:hypothetical protein n=1 Tax=Sulfitobacter dubius TaxID=218673 RepID=UPI001FAE0965|nr:hypothetical protein [Sulfitobacter dubius]
MTVDEAISRIDEAPRGQTLIVAQEVIALLSEMDQLMAGGDLEEYAILRDPSSAFEPGL